MKVKHYFRLFHLSLGLMFYSCSDEEAPSAAPPDATKPTITIVSPTDVSQPLRATVVVKAEASDDTGISKVEVFVDGSSIGSAISSPVEASWDTKTVADGSHQIKVVATDSEGNTEEKSITVEVKNILFTFTIGTNYLNEFEEGWIFITDSNGGLVDNQKMVNGTILTFDTPEGFTNESRFTFNRLEYFFEDSELDPSQLDIALFSYVGLLTNSYVLDNGKTQNPISVGSHTVLVTDALSTFFFSGVESLDARKGSFSGVFPLNTLPIRADLWKSPTKIIYWISPGEGFPIKHEITEAIAGDTIELQVADFSPFDSKKIVLSGAIVNSFRLNYLTRPGDYVNTEFFFSHSKTSDADLLEVIFPDINPPEFLTFLSFDEGNLSHSYQTANKEPAGEFKLIDGSVMDFNFDGSKIQIESAGDFLYLSTSSVAFEIDEDFNSEVISWLINSPADATTTIPVPDIPAELLERYTELADHVFDFNSYSLLKATGVNGYEDWVKLRFSGQSTFSVAKEQFIKTGFGSSSGGRVAGESIREILDDSDGMTKFRKR